MKTLRAVALVAALLIPMTARAQPMPGTAWCPMPSAAPIGGWYWFVPCGWVPTSYPYLYSVAAVLPSRPGFSNVWFTVGNYNPYMPRIDVPMPALWDTGAGSVFYDGCSEALGAFVDWYSIGSFTSYVAVPGALGAPAPAQPLTVGMSGICPN